MTAWDRTTERIKRLGRDCAHPYAGAWPCIGCVTYMIVEYEEALGALQDRRCDDGGWPRRDGPDNDGIVKRRPS